MAKKLEYISFLKGIAILGVFWVHSPQAFGLSPYFNMFFWPGAFGCQLFFLLSGFLSVLSWKRIKESSCGEGVVWKFYKRRWKSIFPIYLLAILVWQLISIWLEWQFAPEKFMYRISHDWLSILMNVLLLNGFDINNFNNVVPGGWFIGTIVIFYLLFPLFIKWYETFKKGKFNLNFIPLIAVLFSAVVQLVCYYQVGNWYESRRWGYLYYSFINQAVPFLLGIQAYYKLEGHGKDKISLNKMILLMSIYMVIGLGFFYLIRTDYWINIFIPYFIGYTWYYMFFIVKCKFEEKSWIGNINTNSNQESSLAYAQSKRSIFISQMIKKIENLGTISFGIYFSNFVGCFLLPWIIIRILTASGLMINAYLGFLLLFPFMWIITYWLGKYLETLISTFSKHILL